MIQKGFDYNQEDLLKAICSVGVNRGDIVFSHVGMSRLGSPKERSWFTLHIREPLFRTNGTF